jgi:peptidyl-Lys metalloendopeptidase
MRMMILAVLLLNAQSALGQSLVQCSPAQGDILRATLDQAKSQTIKAASAVADTHDYARWFGTYAPGNAETVRATLKGVVQAIRGGGVSLQCDDAAAPGCRNGEFAWVYVSEPYHIYLCPSFFDMPALSALPPGRMAPNTGTREGTLVHELSHFRSAGGTADHCYTRRLCAKMAQTAPARAITNADSYQYFTEDVTFGATRPVSGKPAPQSDR